MFGRTRVAIMGTGKIAGVMAQTLKNTKGVTCYAVGSRTENKAREFASRYGIKRHFGSYESLVADPKVDLVYVATPHSEHFENVKLALLNGKHVLCEKAFMLNEEQAKNIFKLAEEKNLLVVEAMWVRFMPMRNKLMEILASGVIGEPTMLTANLGYNIAAKERIAKPELGGGALLDLGVYVLNFASMVFGDDVTDIVSMCSFNNFGMDLHDSITLRYRDGKMAVLNASALSVSDRSGVIYGSKGYIVVDNINNFEGITVYDSNHKKVAYYKRPKQKTGYEYEVEACVRALNEKWLECPEMPHSETLKILNMMDFIRKTNGINFPIEKDSALQEQVISSDSSEPEALECREENEKDSLQETVSDTEAGEGASEITAEENMGAIEDKE
ncbi:MAG: Gfo/Idh/MocA family oxidoreductase [Butyrivibrio sp.]|uniref:Gfo/Idh/MocA family protein n=1 Tax=Butyrivibrio sp. TaxID=28121 RepID=UPI001B204C9C|nr:Gfo/Idh/MocA family oxidoreductase [Butyrivibrio sp.]MBO6241791.1 Gfo/Idh/MocA family oxidoreductase [Butyrivibrio sp.]